VPAAGRRVVSAAISSATSTPSLASTIGAMRPRLSISPASPPLPAALADSVCGQGVPK